MKAVTLSGPRIRLFINNKPYNVGQTISFVMDTGDTEIYGIDSIFPQEIAVVRASTAGQVQGVRIGGQGGLQKDGIKDLLKNVLAGPYVNIRIKDRATGEDILFIPQAKVGNEQHSVSAKGIYRLNFSFKGIAAYQPLDRT